ncbi:hypothetical protein [Photobacterium nomapromontoriensis]|uniref:hypothetical protein n=1 Tax=Photobacterium nomapromontoriensis TaxID=2910237 RepID=UPI003D0A6EAF
MTIKNKTGRVAEVIKQRGKVARLALANGAIVEVAASHKVKPGDWVVEGELSRELVSK